MRLLIFTMWGLIAIISFASWAGPGKSSDGSGGIDGGGGNVIISLSTQQQVKAAIDNAKINFLLDIQFEVYRDFKAGAIDDPEVLQVLKAFFKKVEFSAGSSLINSTVQEDLAITQFQVMQGGCKAPLHQKTDASVESLKIGAPICFSVLALQHISDLYLENQVKALLAHEVTHQFGFGEEVAIKVQKYFLTLEGGHMKYWGNNVTLANHEDTGRLGDENGIISIRGTDARALYDSLSSEATYSMHNSAFPPGWTKGGENINCQKYDQPIPENSEFMQMKKKLGIKLVRHYDYDCTIRFFQKSGRVSAPW